eukprot:CCRYP_013950-RA/>CCRYP_013950-RA protein AED:0.18 eAED:0.18 QI:165/0.66/0.5/1/0.66/0.75/4/0/246
MKSALFLAALFAPASAIELTPDNWDAETSGKTAFIKFFAPWCGHCKKMKPDWDKLMEAYAGSATQLVAEVDCTAAGKPLCDQVGVRGYPTIKYGDPVLFWGGVIVLYRTLITLSTPHSVISVSTDSPADLQDYQGGRDYESFDKFAKENLKPMCSPKNLDLCDDAKKAEITKFQSMSDADLDKAIAEEEKKLEDAEAEFKAEVQKLQDKYTALSTEKDEKIAAVKAAGLGLMKAVKASKPSGNDEL